MVNMIQTVTVKGQIARYSDFCLQHPLLVTLKIANFYQNFLDNSLAKMFVQVIIFSADFLCSRIYESFHHRRNAGNVY